MVNGFRYYRALESVSTPSALSTDLTIYPCQIRVHQRWQSKLQLPTARKEWQPATADSSPVNTVIHTTLLGLEPAILRSLVDCWSDVLPVVPPTHHINCHFWYNKLSTSSYPIRQNFKQESPSVADAVQCNCSPRSGGTPSNINEIYTSMKSTFSGLQFCRWQYRSISIRLAGTAFQMFEIVRNSKRIWPCSSSR